MSTLFLIPTTLSPNIDHHILTQLQCCRIKHLKYFIVETPKIARQHLKYLDLNVSLQNLIIYELNKYQQHLEPIMQTLLKGFDIGLISDCGMPAIADPGNNIVRLAHQNNIIVTPLAGSSSILMALMASGVNGQSFAFNGYIAINAQQRISQIKQMQDNIRKYNQSQIVIEAPFRNQQLLQVLIDNLDHNIVLCIATNLMSTTERIMSQTVHQWRKLSALPHIHKTETVFVIGS